HPFGEKRENLTIRSSGDGGETWSDGVVVTAGPAAYSDLVITDAGTVLRLYEPGEEKRYESLRLRTFLMDDLVSDRSTDAVLHTRDREPAPAGRGPAQSVRDRSWHRACGRRRQLRDPASEDGLYRRGERLREERHRSLHPPSRR